MCVCECLCVLVHVILCVFLLLFFTDLLSVKRLWVMCTLNKVKLKLLLYSLIYSHFKLLNDGGWSYEQANSVLTDVKTNC